VTNTEMIEAVERGERIAPECSIHSEVQQTEHHWCSNHKRVIVCCSATDKDVVECARCGQQWVSRCTFDEDYA
jgi:hypothetical protein